jgi:ribonuclease G
VIDPAEGLLISVSPGEARIALIEDGRLAELWIDREADRSRVGDVFRGRVGKVDAGLQGAFVDLGPEGTGFLGFETGGARVNEGESVVVQVVRDADGGKSLGLRTRIELGGRLVVFNPIGAEISVSRRIPAATERERLRGVLVDAAIGDEGWLARTAAVGAPDDEIADEMAELRAAVAAWPSRTAVPSLLYREPDAVSRALRDLTFEGMRAILVDDGPTLSAVRAYAERNLPELVPLIARYDGREPLLERIEDELARALAHRIALPGGGALTFDATAALTAVDVDFGAAPGAGRRNPVDINLAAADEIARQIRLRDIGGLVVVDFIRMRDRGDRDRLIELLAAAVEHDRLPVQVMGMTRAGLVELQRPRGRVGLRALMARACPVCAGTGTTPAPLAAALAALREVAAASAGAPPVIVAAPDVAQVLGDEAAAPLAETGRRLGAAITVESDDGLAPGGFEIRPAG